MPGSGLVLVVQAEAVRGAAAEVEGSLVASTGPWPWQPVHVQVGVPAAVRLLH